MGYYDNAYYNQYGVQAPGIDSRMMQLQQQRNVLNSPMVFNQNTQQPMLKGRMVSSFDEVKAAMIDLDGSVFIFPDIANNRIYTKQIGMNGSAIFNVYSLSNPIEQQTNQNEPVARSEFEKMIQQFNEKFQEYDKKIGGLTDVSNGQDDANGKYVKRTKSAASFESALKSVSE